MAHTIHNNYKTEWETPRNLFDQLDREFAFTLDAAASHSNALVKNYFTEEDDALKQRWEGSVFCNPPYGKDIMDWVEKAWVESGKPYCDVIVMLLPANTDTKWFHKFVYGYAEIRFIQGRVQFLLDGKKQKSGNPGASIVAVYYGERSIKDW